MSKADEARVLLAQGMSVSDVAKKVGAHYSQVHGIAKAMGKGSTSVTKATNRPSGNAVGKRTPVGRPTAPAREETRALGIRIKKVGAEAEAPAAVVNAPDVRVSGSKTAAKGGRRRKPGVVPDKATVRPLPVGEKGKRATCAKCGYIIEHRNTEYDGAVVGDAWIHIRVFNLTTEQNQKLYTELFQFHEGQPK